MYGGREDYRGHDRGHRRYGRHDRYEGRGYRGRGGYHRHGRGDRFAPKRMFRIFGTEEDKVNCSFYFKIGACRHGERCSRLHVKPNFSQTLLLAHFYMPPESGDARDPIGGANIPHSSKSLADDREYYEDFYEDVLAEMSRFGDVLEMVVCQNLGDHMFGNTYVKFATEEQAAKGLADLRGRYYRGRVTQCEYSPVTDFREGRCRQFDERDCARGDFCNFLHLKPVPRFAQRYFGKARGRESNERSFERDDVDDDGDVWPAFHYRGTSAERRDVVSQWNVLLDKKRQRAAEEMAAATAVTASTALPTAAASAMTSAMGIALAPVSSAATGPKPFVNPERMAMIS